MDIDKVLEKLRIKELNNMQQAACKAILGTNDDIVILSPTGSGKTLAYLLPSAHLVDETKCQDVNSPCSQVMCSSPWLVG